MKKIRKAHLAVIVGLGIVHVASFAAVKVEEQVLVPKVGNAQIVVSPAGTHVAAVMAKGSRAVVVFDGVESQKFDTLLNLDGTPFMARSSGGPTPGGPVLFSSDGTRYAYSVHVGDDYIVMVDGKELARGPWTERLSFRPFAFSEAGNHFYFGFNTGDPNDLKAGYRMQVENQPGPVSRDQTSTGAHTNDNILFSSDGAHYVYIGTATRDKPEGKWAVVDGKQVGYFGEDLQFAQNKRRLFSVAQIPPKWGTPPVPGATVLLIDAKPVLKAQYFTSPVWVSPNGDHYAVAITPRENATGFLTIDGKPVPGTEGVTVRGVYFSPDGKRLAILCTPAGATSGGFMILDGKKQQKYQSIESETTVFEMAPRFSADSSKFFYAARNNSGRFLVINEDESDAGFAQGPYFTSGDARMAYTVAEGNTPNSDLYVDDKSVFKGQLTEFSFSPDGAHYAFVANQQLYLDGAKVSDFALGEFTGLVQSGTNKGQFERYHYIFSPDSKHVVYLAGDPNNEAHRGLWVDKSFIFHSPSNYAGSILHPTFTPDGQHLFWYDRVAPSVAEPQGHFQLYVDGERSVTFAPSFLSYERGSNQGVAWEMGPDGVLQFLVLADNVVKRVRVTPSADTSVATMMAAAK